MSTTTITTTSRPINTQIEKAYACTRAIYFKLIQINLTRTIYDSSALKVNEIVKVGHKVKPHSKILKGRTNQIDDTHWGRALDDFQHRMDMHHLIEQRKLIQLDASSIQKN